jgi:hypothetical protein
MNHIPAGNAKRKFPVHSPLPGGLNRESRGGVTNERESGGGGREWPQQNAQKTKSRFAPLFNSASPYPQARRPANRVARADKAP